MVGFRVSWVLVLVSVWCLAAASPLERDTRQAKKPNGKLLYILMDGFRWDYVDLQSPEVLPGFTKFLKEGVRAQWVDPLFPSISYPTWTTLATGLYAESHGIVGNYFYDAESKDVFSLFDAESTGKEKWWTAEPIWTTAERASLRTAQFLWARCDVPINGITTEFCEPFVKIPGKEIFDKNIKRALEKFDEGFDFVQVYTEHTDNTGHNYGPDSEDVKQAVRDLDGVLMTLMNELERRGRTDVNIVIVSDHGMTDTAPGNIERHEIDNYLTADLVENMADKGALMNIKVPEENVEQVYQQVSSIPGVNALKHEDIPEEYHYKNNKYVHDVVLVSDAGNFVMSSSSGKMLPPKSDFVYYGAHGYTTDLKDMKGIFFARGPAFNQDLVIEPIHMVDVYQVLAHVLGVPPQPNNGTWTKVQPALMESMTDSHSEGTEPTVMGHDDHHNETGAANNETEEHSTEAHNHDEHDPMEHDGHDHMQPNEHDDHMHDNEQDHHDHAHDHEEEHHEHMPGHEDLSGDSYEHETHPENQALDDEPTSDAPIRKVPFIGVIFLSAIFNEIMMY